MKQKFLLTTLLFSLFSFSIIAQTGSVRGFVYIEKTGEPAIFTNVFLKGTTYGTSTDDNGYFNLSRIPIGKYTLIATSIGFDTAKAEVEITKADDIVDQNTKKAPCSLV